MLSSRPASPSQTLTHRNAAAGEADEAGLESSACTRDGVEGAGDVEVLAQMTVVRLFGPAMPSRSSGDETTITLAKMPRSRSCALASSRLGRPGSPSQNTLTTLSPGS